MFIYQHVPTIKLAQYVHNSNSGAQLGAILTCHYLNCLPVEIFPRCLSFLTKGNGNSTISSYHSKSYRIWTFNIYRCTHLTSNYTMKYKPVLFAEVPFDSITLHCNSCRFQGRALYSYQSSHLVLVSLLMIKLLHQ